MGTNMVMEISIYEENIKRNFFDSIKNKNAIREQKQMLKDAYENDQEYESAKIDVDDKKKKLATVKTKLDNLPSIVAIKEKIKVLKEERSDIQGGLFDNLEGYIRHTGQRTIEIEGNVRSIVANYSLI